MCLSIRLSFFSFFFFKQKPAYELRISDWSSDVCSSDLVSLLVDEAALQAMMERARARGVECRGIADHGFIRSIYLRDPNGYVVELAAKIGRASCRERVCQYVSISVVAVSIKKKEKEVQATSYQSRNKRSRKKQKN